MTMQIQTTPLPFAVQDELLDIQESLDTLVVLLRKSGDAAPSPIGIAALLELLSGKVSYVSRVRLPG